MILNPASFMLLGSLTTITAAARAATLDPALNGIVLFEVQNDLVSHSDDADAEVNTLYTTVEPYLILSLTERLAIETSLVFEPVQGTDPGDDTAFENEGLYAEELKISYQGENFSLFAGKYNPSFGTAWDLTPGLYGTDFAEDYELTERVGFGGSYTVGNEAIGEHTLGANTFFADTSFLSDSTVTRRGERDRNDGGLSNTEDFSSFSLTLDSENPCAVEGLNTHLGYRNQSEGDEDTGLSNETGYAAGINYTLPISANIEAMALAEWAGLRNVDGGADDRDYYTFGVALNIYGNWNVSASWTGRGTSVAAEGEPDVDDDLYQLSAGYTFENGITFDVGYSTREESEIDSDTVGAVIAYTYEF